MEFQHNTHNKTKTSSPITSTSRTIKTLSTTFSLAVVCLFFSFFSLSTMMILGVPEARCPPSRRAHRTPPPMSSSGEEGEASHHPIRSAPSSSSVPLQTLVAIASSLFDESNRMEQTAAAAAAAAATPTRQEQQQQQQQQQPHIPQCREGNEEPPLPQTPSRATTKTTTTAATTAAATTTTKRTASTGSVPNPGLAGSAAAATTTTTTTTVRRNFSTTGSIPLPSFTRHSTAGHHRQPANAPTPQRPRAVLPSCNPPGVQCCTREGFLSRLRTVLDDPLMEDVLSWMPDGEAFTIVSPKRFAKKGLVYQLFGIKKMSSFLRRLNQLGFARVRDPTDPTNLDVFRKKGFSAHDDDDGGDHGGAAGNNTTTTKPVEERTGSPTSTLLFAPAALLPVTTAKHTAATVPGSAPQSPVADSGSSTASSLTTTSSLTASSSFGGSSNNDIDNRDAAGAAASPRPPVRAARRRFVSISDSSPASIIPLAMPAPPAFGGGPVRLLPRGEGFAAVTPGASLRPGSPLRPPPVQFVAECIQRMAEANANAVVPPAPMDVVGESLPGGDPLPPTPGHPGRSYAHMRHNREYLSLYLAADDEANTILRAVERHHDNDGDHHLHHRCSYEASVLSAVELLRGGGGSYRSE